MDDLEIYKRLGLALAIGLLFGVERGWHTRAQSGGTRVAGIRTFALMGLLGGVGGWLTILAGPVVLGVMFAGLAGLIGVSYWLRTPGDGDRGITTEVAALLVFSLGAAAVLGEMAPAAAAGVIATALLAVKSALHGWIEQIRRIELTAAIELGIISVVMLPLLPDRGYGPAGALNPYALWWAVVLVASLSFCGYVAMRIAGARLGTLLTGLFGGLTSSTATTLAFSRMARQAQTLRPVLAVGVVLAGSVTFLRILVLTSIFAPGLAVLLALPLGIMAAAGLAGALILLWAAAPTRDTPGDLETLSNPLELAMAIKFGAILAVVTVATHAFEAWFGTAGLHAVAALSGIADVDALTISVARMTTEDLALQDAALAIITAASVNTAVKGGIALVVGGREIGLRVIAVYLCVLALGGLALWSV